MEAISDTSPINSVDLVGHYGSDTTHALSAWTSTSRSLTGEKMDRIPGLLKFLAENGHHTPFEKSALHFLVRVDTATHIQLLKHRIGVSVNGESARYKQLNNLTALLPIDWPQNVKSAYKVHVRKAMEQYEWALEELEKTLGRKRAKESARFFLPYGNQLTLDIQFNFRSFMHFQGLRNKPDAQKEICDLAQVMLELVHETGDFNNSLEAFGYNETSIYSTDE